MKVIEWWLWREVGKDIKFLSASGTPAARAGQVFLGGAHSAMQDKKQKDIGCLYQPQQKPLI